MKVRDKNPLSRELIEDMHRKGFENEADVWKAVAKGLNRPSRKKYTVNVYRLEKFAKPKDTIVVPGSVLGHGEITKAVTVAALRFSDDARKKIEKAGGKCLTIKGLSEKDPKGSRVRIMG